jgi:uncharacterized protein with PQ loop repeat
MLMVRHAHAQKHLQKKAQRDSFDWILHLFMVATPLFELPQVIKIYGTQSAADVSLVTWAFFALSNVAWILYAIRHNMRLLVGIYSAYLLIEVTIVIGIILYQ